MRPCSVAGNGAAAAAAAACQAAAAAAAGLSGEIDNQVELNPARHIRLCKCPDGNRLLLPLPVKVR